MFKKSCVLIRNILLLLICCRSLVAYDDFDHEALSKLNLQPTTLEDWRVKGYFVVNDNLRTGTCYYDMEFISVSSKSLIKNIIFTNSTFNVSKPRLSFILNDKYEKYFGNNINSSCYNLICDSPEKINNSLKNLYDLKAIPNFIIDKILWLPEFNIKDFWLNTARQNID